MLRPKPGVQLLQQVTEVKSIIEAYKHMSIKQPKIPESWY